MRKKIIFLLLSLKCFLSFGQDLEPYFTDQSEINVADGHFENLNENCFYDACYTKANCVNWGPYELPEGIVGKIHKAECLNIDTSQADIIENFFCSMYVNSTTNIKEKIVGLAFNLIPFRFYTVKFYQLNIKNQLGLDEQHEFDSSIARFKVSFGSQVALGAAMNYNMSNPSLLFEEQSFVFMATNTSAIFQIEPMMIEINRKASTRLAIDRITIRLNPIDGIEEPVDDPVDDVEVPQPCKDCTSFELTRNENYVFSGWVKQTKVNYDIVDTISYENSFIEVDFDNAPGNLHILNPSGEIIDGWQKISKTITIPSTATELYIRLRNTSENLAFFDDIRVHPFNGNLKSFVYDQQTQRLMAELDENNYATFYEYDQEGGLVRVKKETEKGIFTIQETRSSTIKRANTVD